MNPFFSRITSASFLALAALSAPLPAGAQGQATLVIEGGTLIDGNGGAPLVNSVVIVQGNRIASVSTLGQLQIPAGARMVDARGKWVLPGLWDNVVNYSWFYGELALNQGVTSMVDIARGEELSIVHRDAVNRGRIKAPRAWIGIGYFGGLNPNLTGHETELATRAWPKTVAETGPAVFKRLDAGADMIVFQEGRNFTTEIVRAGCEAAHSRNKPCVQRPNGPTMWPRDAVAAGVDIFPLIGGIGASVIRDGATANNELDRFAQMDDAKARDLAQLLAREEVYLAPAIINVAPGYPRDWDRMYSQVRQLFTDPNLLAYYPDAFLKELTVARTQFDTGAVRERRMPGYRNMLRFLKMYVDAGGKLLVGGQTNANLVAGLSVKEEMEILAEANIAPMQIIMGATKWAAASMRVQNDVGTIESGKLADIVIVSADPLQQISNLRNVDSVIFDGRPVELGFTAHYATPFMGNREDVPVVEALHWTAALKEKTFGGGGGNAPPNPTLAPQPAIETIAPFLVTEGDPTTTLKLTGFNFIAKSRVYVDGVSVPWRWVSSTELEVTLDAELLKRAGRFDVVVTNPPPLELPEWGNGTSNKAHLVVNFRY